MNKQYKSPTNRGVEWTDFTHNIIGGCEHECGWDMPDGSLAICYAKTVAEGIARAAYPLGFEQHYWHPERLEEPLKLKTPAKIFIDSMSDLMGHWVPSAQVEQVLDMCRRAHWHQFQLLTKNPPRLNKFDFPPNVWVGVSAPPSRMMGKALTLAQQSRWFYVAVNALARCNARIKWVSFEPLSFDIVRQEMGGEGWEELVGALDWAVIGAASNGKRYYQPDPAWVEALVDLLACYDIPIFYKGNLRDNPAARPWREEFPELGEIDHR